MADDSLLPSKLLPLALSLLSNNSNPTSSSTDSSTSTETSTTEAVNSNTLTTPIEALGLLIHSIQTSVGFRLIEPKPIGENQLPLNWSNNSSPKFKYKHEQSSLDFIISIVELGGRALIAAVAVEDNKSVSFDLLLLDYFSPSAFPFSVPPPSFTDNNSFATVFSSSNRIKDLITLYRLNILQPLIPGLRKEGYTELDSNTSTNTSGSTSSSSGSGSTPSTGPSRGYYPDNGGPLGPYGGGTAGGGFGIPVPLLPNLPNLGGPRNGGRIPNLGEIGSRDLDPLGGGIPGFPGLRTGGEGGGMYMGPDHPLFRERFGPDTGLGGLGGNEGRRWGGDGWLPQGAAPPGARFDPIGPSNGPPQPGGVGIGGFGGGRGIGGFNGAGRGGRAGGGFGGGFGGPSGGRNGGFGGSNSSNGIGGDPDWDELPPPGDSNNDYDAMFG